MRTLDRLFAPFGVAAPRWPVRGITLDSRQAGPEQIFVAVPGHKQDGHRYIGEAIAHGTTAVVGERALSLPVPYLRVPNARAALSRLAAELFGHPSRSLQVVGVTGTKGKTTTSALIHHLLEASGRAAGLLCTVGIWYGRRPTLPRGHLTTPEAPELQATLARMVQCALGYVVIETSSHALALQRVADVHYDLAVWTTLHPEHLDFHGDMESYFRAKASLFERAPFAVLNADCPYAMRLTHRPHLSYGVGRGDVRAEQIREGTNSLAFLLHAPGFCKPVRLRGIGRFNVHNALAALAAAFYLGVPLPTAAASLRRFPGVPGRMQVVRTHPARVIVDFAHTPDSLAQAIAAARHDTPGRLFVLTGASGGRDPRKRAPMGRLAVEQADLVIFAEEDSWGESLPDILEALERGARAAGGRRGRDYVVIPDRTLAIRFALRHARPGDTILLTGKGHERFLARSEGTIPWDEAGEARRLAEEEGW